MVSQNQYTLFGNIKRNKLYWCTKGAEVQEKGQF